MMANFCFSIIDTNGTTIKTVARAQVPEEERKIKQPEPQQTYRFIAS